MYEFKNGKFVYDTHVSYNALQGSTRVVITLDLNNPAIARLISKALVNTTHRAVEAAGALKVEVKS